MLILLLGLSIVDVGRVTDVSDVQIGSIFRMK
jgi:hypothetical protein